MLEIVLDATFFNLLASLISNPLTSLPTHSIFLFLFLFSSLCMSLDPKSLVVWYDAKRLNQQL